ncbi:MAG: hypothetical protein ABIK28_06300 [Planctomycetota bacterium]
MVVLGQVLEIDADVVGRIVVSFPGAMSGGRARGLHLFHQGFIAKRRITQRRARIKRPAPADQVFFIPGLQKEIGRRLDEADRLHRLQVERVKYEADLARQRYMHVDPANRLVADSLEAEWNAKLHALEGEQQDYQHRHEADRLVIDVEERRRILSLATDFPAIWRNPKTPQRERKRMLALLIEDVTLTKQQEILAAVRFRGGETTLLTLPRPLTAQQLRVTHPEVRRQIDALLNEYTDAQVAHILNERGLRTGAGKAFDAAGAQRVRTTAKLLTLEDRLIAAGMLTAKELGEKLGVGRTTLGRWRIQGFLKARICNAKGKWLYWPPEHVVAKRKTKTKGAANAPMDRSLVCGAV